VQTLLNTSLQLNGSGKLLIYMLGSGSDFGQLPGLFSFLQLGLKPDMPSPNGVNRVVQAIEIYEQAWGPVHATWCDAR
jgi:hypothetical protein